MPRAELAAQRIKRRRRAAAGSFANAPGCRSGVLVALLLLAATLAPAGRSPARAQEPPLTIVVTTPTPTPVPLPTPTPQPPHGYVVQEGDTLLTVALELGVDVDEMGCIVRPDFDPTQALVIGDQLLPMPQGTICRRTEAGDSVRTLAEEYGVAPESIAGDAWNQLPDTPDLALSAGRFVRIALDSFRGFEPVFLVSEGADVAPFIRLMLAQPANSLPQDALGRGGPRRTPSVAPAPADWPYGSGRFLWPTYGILSQSYRYDHRALDIAAQTGSPVTASDRGVVIRAGWNNQGYGNFVIVDHNIDYVTLYAHLDKVLVVAGDVVAPGQILGTVGETGNTTGPHLHFEIRDFGRLTNPLELLAQ